MRWPTAAVLIAVLLALGAPDAIKSFTSTTAPAEAAVAPKYAYDYTFVWGRINDKYEATHDRLVAENWEPYMESVATSSGGTMFGMTHFRKIRR